jgi:DNA-binding HxlR family transcriptional regulator
VSTRTYGHYCAVARALDAVGDRWALLVVRELLDGPKRYTDLREGLPGISTDLLASRLRDLEREGLVERQILPPPAASKVYRLTDDGAALEPVLVALAGWGTRRLSTDQDGEFRSQWLTLSLRSMFTPAAAQDDTVTVDFLVNSSRLRARIDRGALTFDHHPTGPADVVISGDAAALSALARSPEDRTAVIAEGRVTIDGDPHAIAALQRAFGLEPRP